MKRRRSLRFQLRLIFSYLGGILAALLAAPFLLPTIEIGNVVVAFILGAVLFLVLAIIGGIVWQPSIMARPVPWALAAPVAVAIAMYLLLRLLSGFDPGEAAIAAEASLLGGFCAMFASAIFLVSVRVAPVAHEGDGDQ